MKKLFTIDLKDYNPNGKKFYRPSVRGVIFDNNGNESGEDIIHVQQNFYYTCKVETEIGEQNLDDGEKDLDFALKFIPAEEAIQTNAAFKSDDSFKAQIAERDKRVLEIVKDFLSLAYPQFL